MKGLIGVVAAYIFPLATTAIGWVLAVNEVSLLMSMLIVFGSISTVLVIAGATIIIGTEGSSSENDIK